MNGQRDGQTEMDREMDGQEMNGQRDGRTGNGRTERRTDNRWMETDRETDRDMNEQRRTEITGTQAQLKVIN